MANEEGADKEEGGEDVGRWDVSIKNDAVHVERFSGSDEQVFDDLLAPDEARRLAGLLTKFADKLDETEKRDDNESHDESKDSKDSKEPKDSDDDESAEDDDDSDEPEDSKD